MSGRTYRTPYFQADESSYSYTTLEGASTVVSDGLGQKIVLKNTLFPKEKQNSMPRKTQEPAPFGAVQSASGLFGASNKVDGLKQILDRKRVN